MKSIDKFAELVIRTGINIQKGQTLVILAPVQVAEFVRRCVRKAYENGANRVVVNWYDEPCDRDYYLFADDQTLSTPEMWKVDRSNYYAEMDAAFLSICSDDPDVMKDVNPEKLNLHHKTYAKPFEAYRSRLMSNKNAWCVISVPSKEWAQKVYPDLQAEEAIEHLWEAIFKVTRVMEDDPVQEWANHQGRLDEKLDVLNSQQFTALKYRNSLGTNITVELPLDHIWYGGADVHIPKGYKFVANMPTEEVFTAPKYNGVNGKVVASYPLVYQGSLIQGFWLEFKDGVVIDYGAEDNLELLSSIFDIDEGAKRLGEVALVPYDSPISNLGILFYDTLFDENAACHFALGEAYPICVKNGEHLDKATLLEKGLNISDTHIDFMVGTSDLDIVAIKSDGSEVQLFHQGNFVL